MSLNRWKPSVTVAAVVAQHGRFLLVEEQTAAGLMLNTPAGHLEPGESLQQGAVRETLEETTRLFEPTALLGVYMAASKDAQGALTTWLRFAFCGMVDKVDPQRSLDQGIVRELWMTPSEIEASRTRHRSPLVWQCVRDYLAGKRYPLELVSVDPSALMKMTAPPFSVD